MLHVTMTAWSWLWKKMMTPKSFIVTNPRNFRIKSSVSVCRNVYFHIFHMDDLFLLWTCSPNSPQSLSIISCSHVYIKDSFTGCLCSNRSTWIIIVSGVISADKFTIPDYKWEVFVRNTNSMNHVEWILTVNSVTIIIIYCRKPKWKVVFVP